MTASRVLRDRERQAAAERARLDGLTLEEKINAGRANAANRAADLMPERTLPDVGPEIDLATMTMPELHDLVYNAASTMLRDSMRHLPKHARQLHAERVANQALLIVRGQDYTHQGPDPRG